MLKNPLLAVMRCAVATGLLCLLSLHRIAHAQTLQWVKLIDQAGSPYPEDLHRASSGNLIAAGKFNGLIDCDPGPGTATHTPVGSYDGFIAGYTSSGNYLWSGQIGGSTLAEPNKVTSDNAGNVIVTGVFSGAVDLNPGTGVHNALAALTYSHFVIKLDSAGNFLWAHAFGGSDVNYGCFADVDSTGNILIAGDFRGTFDFDPGPGSHLLNAGFSKDAYLLKLDPTGQFLWARNFEGSPGFSNVQAIEVDDSGNVYAAGSFRDSVDFDPGPGVFIFPSATGERLFACKLNSSGDLIWAKETGGCLSTAPNDLCLDFRGNLTLTGRYQGTLNFDPGISAFSLSSTGIHDAFVYQLNPLGEFKWAAQLGGSGNEVGMTLITDGNGGIYSTGQFTVDLDMDPGPGSFPFAALGAFDAYTSKLDSNGKFVWAGCLTGSGGQQIRGLDIDPFGGLYLWGGFGGLSDLEPDTGIVNMTPFYTNSLFLSKLRICDATTGTLSVSSCNSFTSPSGHHVWTSSGIYTDTLLNSSGCDSVLTVNLTLLLPTTDSISISTCDSLVSPSGLHTWTSSGIYRDTLTNAVGCDSVLTVNLTVNLVDTSVMVTLPTLTANAAAATYQWIYCDSSAIAGETNQSFEPAVSGSYAVIVTEGGCSDTSACHTVIVVDATPPAPEDGIFVYPNPTHGQVTLSLPQAMASYTYSLSSVTGGIILRGVCLQSQVPIDLSPYPAGFYLLTVFQPHGNPQHLTVVKH